MVKLHGAVVVITGASSGIGQATAEGFAREGARLVLAARDPQALEAVAQRCRRLGGEAVAVAIDATDIAQVRALRDRVLALAGRIDVWFSNVGLGAVGKYHVTPMEAHEQVIRANLISHMNDAHAVVPVFLRQGYGIFINMISLGAFFPTPYAAAYSASKFGLKGFSDALRAELSHEPHIHVCDVFPTFVDTPAMDHAGNYTGRRLSAPPPVYDARKVARAVVDLASQPRSSVMIGAPAWLARISYAIAPRLSVRIAARMMRAYFERAPAAPYTAGSLYRPPRVAGGIDGDLRSPVQRQLAVAAGIAALAVGAFMLARPHVSSPHRRPLSRRVPRSDASARDRGDRLRGRAAP